MMRFIFVCMAIVAVTGVMMATQSMTGGISDAREEVLARNVVPAPTAAQPADEEISFEEIYANAKAPEVSGEAFFSPEELNTIETTAGGNEFSGAFTDQAPKALAEPVRRMAVFPGLSLH